MLRSARIKIGISSCLLGQRVRYDGGSKRHSYLVQKLGQYFELVAVCPEVGIGMPVPRPPIQLVKRGNEIRVLDVKTQSQDYTEALSQYPDTCEVEIEKLSGYVLKSNSPSCGLYQVNVFTEDNNQTPVARDGVGMFTTNLRSQFPLLQMEEEARLSNTVLRRNFMLKIIIYHRWQLASGEKMQPGDLKWFHSDCEYLLKLYDRSSANKLGQIASRAGTAGFELLRSDYIHELMQLLNKKVTSRKLVNICP